jgi:hypothetical protein
MAVLDAVLVYTSQAGPKAAALTQPLLVAAGTGALLGTHEMVWQGLEVCTVSCVLHHCMVYDCWFASMW